LSTARKSGEDGEKTGEKGMHVTPDLQRPKAQNASDQGRQAWRGVRGSLGWPTSTSTVTLCGPAVPCSLSRTRPANRETTHHGRRSAHCSMIGGAPALSRRSIEATPLRRLASTNARSNAQGGSRCSPPLSTWRFAFLGTSTCRILPPANASYQYLRSTTILQLPVSRPPFFTLTYEYALPIHCLMLSTTRLWVAALVAAAFAAGQGTKCEVSTPQPVQGSPP
jgi:hypothetical protein